MYRFGQSLLLAVLVTQISGNVFLQRRVDTGVNVNAQVKLPSLPSPPMLDQSNAPSMPNMPSLNPNGTDYSLYGYLASFYNHLPGINTMTSFLRTALSYIPEGSSLYNAICKALDDVIPDYATLKSLYDQVRAQIVQDREARFRHHEEMMRIKHGLADPPVYPPPQLPHYPPAQGPAGILIN